MQVTDKNMDMCFVLKLDIMSYLGSQCVSLIDNDSVRGLLQLQRNMEQVCFSKLLIENNNEFMKQGMSAQFK